MSLAPILDATSYGASPWALPTALTALAMAVLGLVVFTRERGSREARVFLVVAGAIGLWLGAFSMMYLSTDERVAFLWARAAYLGVAVIPVAVYHFARVVTRDDGRPGFPIVAAWSIAAAFCVAMVFTDALFDDLYRYPWGFYPRFRGLGAPYLVFFAFLLVLSMVAYRRDLKRATTEEHRQRSRRLGLGFAIAYLASVDFVAAYGVAVYPFGYLAVLGFILIAAATIRRYRLVDFTPELAAREILATVADPILVCDRQGRVQLVNRAGRELLGIEDDALLGRRVAELVTGEGEGRALVERALERRRARGVAVALSGAHDRRVEVELAFSPLADRGGVEVGTVIVAHDLTSSRRAAAELAASERQFRALTEQAAAAVFILERGRIVYWNHSAELMSGRSAELLRATPFWELIATEDQAELRSLLDSETEPPSHYRRELRLAGATGGRWVDLTLTTMPRPGGAALLVSAYDVHESKIAASAARASERRWRELLEAVQLAAMMLDREGNVTYCNPYFLELVGYEIEEVVGRNFFELFVARERGDAFLSEFVEKLEQGLPNRFDEYELVTRSGEARWIAWSSTVLRDLRGDIVGAASIGVDLTERKRAEERLVHDAFHDGLTGLPNRALFLDRLRGAIARGRRRGVHTFAVLFLDLDRFKLVNDSFGHLVGDQLLIQVGRRLERCLRPGDTIARLGGDEFTILVEDLDESTGVGRVAERMALELSAPFDLAGNEVFTTASIGIAVGGPRYSEAESLLRDADTALHRAKAEGKARHRIFDTPMHARAVEDLQVENDLRRALERGELTVWYQPIVELEGGRAVGFEALLRWQHPERGLLGPDAFIGVAEETGLIAPIGEWVLGEACRQLAAWQAEYDGTGSNVSVTVNFSSRQLAKADIVERIAEILKREQLDPTRFKLEITESFIVENPEMAAQVLERVRALGCRICLDDFGTGYSSLSYLLRLPIDVLKVDRSFLVDLRPGARNADIVWAVVALAKRLGMQVVAEGVERESQVVHLRELGCEYGQGHYFARPMEAAEAGRLFASGSADWVETS